MKITTMTTKLKVCAAALALAVMMAGCSVLGSGSDSDTGSGSGSDGQDRSASATVSKTIETVEELSVSDKDNDTSYDESDAKLIELSSNSGTVKITEEGTYIVTGSTEDGSIVIEVTEEEDVHLILRDASITSATSAAIYIISADEVYITLEGKNTLANGGEFKAIDENDIDSVIYSKDDLTINGDGTLKITSPAGHAIVVKDDLVITGGTYDITAKEDGINTNDSLVITAGTFNIEVSDDALHTDGVLQIDGGTYDIMAAEGIEGTYIKINDGDITISASDDGINAAQKSDAYTPTIEINGGNIKITMGQGDTDGMDSNGNIVINGGVVDITGQSSFDYDGTASLNGGTLIVNGSEVDSIPNQFMGGGQGGTGGQMADGTFPGGEAPSGDFPGGDFPGGRGDRPERQN